MDDSISSSKPKGRKRMKTQSGHLQKVDLQETRSKAGWLDFYNPFFRERYRYSLLEMKFL